jgi:hypothetical protein
MYPPPAQRDRADAQQASRLARGQKFGLFAAYLPVLVRVTAALAHSRVEGSAGAGLAVLSSCPDLVPISDFKRRLWFGL